MSTVPSEQGRATSPTSAVVPPQSLYEMIEEASYRALENHSPALLNHIATLVALGNTPEAIVQILVDQSHLPRWRVAYTGCAAAYLIKLNSVPETGAVS